MKTTRIEPIGGLAAAEDAEDDKPLELLDVLEIVAERAWYCRGQAEAYQEIRRLLLEALGGGDDK